MSDCLWSCEQTDSGVLKLEILDNCPLLPKCLSILWIILIRLLIKLLIAIVESDTVMEKIAFDVSKGRPVFKLALFKYEENKVKKVALENSNVRPKRLLSQEKL